ncbi:MAG: DUF4347 domain-containing protein, partial [Candidatus Competibacteraceae bacterium]|nr:DUF4347 domain-containing protein [Candidatus Competibacteraceae bacterium]
MSNVKSALESQALFAGTNNARRIVIIDAAVKDTEVLLSAIDPAAQVFYLDANADGVNQIASILSGFSKVEALHVLSHGSAGSVTLGSTILNAANAESYAAKFVEWDV